MARGGRPAGRLDDRPEAPVACAHLCPCPCFAPATTPAPSFAELLRRVGLDPCPSCPRAPRELSIPHGTTCVAVRYADGVVMAGDRRATAGNLISHRTMEKVFPADRHSGVAIAGAAGPAMEMVKLFQLQLEHYEKVEGTPLSLEGKANQLVEMVRGNLPAAMQGLVVVPLFAGYDTRRGPGPPVPVRRHRRPLRGAATTSPPARAACTPAPSSSSATATASTATTPSTCASRRCSRRPTRTPPPAAPTRAGHLPGRGHHHRRRASSGSPTTSCAERFEARRGGDAAVSAARPPRTGAPAHEHAVLRRARAGDEGPGRLRPQGHRPGPQPGRPSIYDDGIAHRAPRTRRTPCARSARSTTASPSPASAGTTSSTSCASPACATPTSRATSTAARTSTPAAWPTSYAQILGQIFTHEMKPMEVEILVAEVGAHAGRRPAVPHPLRRHRHRRAALQRARRRGRRHRGARPGGLVGRA